MQRLTALIAQSMEHAQNVNDMQGKTFVCKTCGYKYNTAAGDLKYDIKPGTAFFELGDDWVCPICKAGKKVFEPLPLGE